MAECDECCDGIKDGSQYVKIYGSTLCTACYEDGRLYYFVKIVEEKLCSETLEELLEKEG